MACSAPLRAASGTADHLAPVGPAWIVRWAIRPLAKVLNPVIRPLAGQRHFRMAAQVHHAGRRSGRRYVTPAGARLKGDVVVIPLTFGNQSDWVRNVRAAGGCSTRLRGKDYRATGPVFLDRSHAGPLLQAAFNPVERLMFRVLGVKQFLWLQVTV